MSPTSWQKTTKSSPVVGGLALGTIRALSGLPWRWTQMLGAAMGYLAWRVPNNWRAASDVNISLCLPELSTAERVRLSRAGLVHTFQTLAELAAMLRWPAERLARLESGDEDPDLIDQAMKAGRGVIVLGPHIGNWEFTSHYLAARYPFAAMYRPPRIRELDEALRKSRERIGAELVPATGTGLRRICRILKDGGLVGILPDQEPHKSHGVFAPFFGVPALTMTLVGDLHRQFGSPVLFGWMERTDKGTFRGRLLPAPEGLDAEDKVAAATQLNLGVEAVVRACPSQYLWSYKRFRTRPEEESAELRRRFGLELSQKVPYTKLECLRDLESPV
ncbi:MAG: lysophospholipid acyltransferase family protein [Thermoanaerobaculia bacterium]